MPTRENSETIDRDIAYYLATGKSDPVGQVSPADTMHEGMARYRQALRDALAEKVLWLSRRRRHPPIPEGMNSTSFVRTKLAPMVNGLFPTNERAVALGIVERSIIVCSQVSSSLPASTTGLAMMVTGWVSVGPGPQPFSA